MINEIPVCGWYSLWESGELGGCTPTWYVVVSKRATLCEESTEEESRELETALARREYYVCMSVSTGLRPLGVLTVSV